MNFAIAAALLLGLAILGFWLRRSLGETARLRRRLDAAAQELERLQLSFGRFAPEQVIEEIIARGVPTEGEKKEVTILFADLVGFTALSESVEPSELVRILNGYFESMTRVIKEHRGYVSTLIGDGILALYGALEPNPWQANDAVHTALAMEQALAEYNRKLESEGFASLDLGIGLHRGQGVAGLVGSRDQLEFTVVGRTINLAARVQDLTRSHEARILITDAVREKLDPRFDVRALPPARVKGIEAPIAIHAVEGWKQSDRD